ncbi:MAG: hypothetical protein KDM91_19470 [Verrucomicrobiae bacterium]|nr:hypothetical protein [Verrucomicrobiae bacterium]
MKSYTFTLTTQPQLCPLPCDKASVAVEITGRDDLSLFELAHALLGAIGFDSDHAFGFHEGLDSVYRAKGKRYTLFADIGEDEDAAAGVSATRVADVFSPGQKMLFHFDYGDDWHFFVTCDAIEESAATRPSTRRLSVTGVLPSQYDDDDDDDDWDDEDWDDSDE